MDADLNRAAYRWRTVARLPAPGLTPAVSGLLPLAACYFLSYLSAT